MKKLLLFLLISLSPVIAKANTQIPANEITVVTSAFTHCLTSAATNVQTALQAVDVCLGNSGSSYTFSKSLVNTSGVVTLVGDSLSPGNSYYYGTNGSGTKGFYALTNSLGSINVQHVNGTITTYNPSTNTNAARGTALLSAVSNAVSGDVIYLAPNTYDIQNNVIDMSLNNTGEISINGSGMYDTIIESSAQGPIIQPGSNSTLSNLEIYTESFPNYQYTWGNFSGNTFTNVIVSNVYMNGNTDAIYTNGGAVQANFYNVYIASQWDTITVASSGNNWTFYNLTTYAPGYANYSYNGTGISMRSSGSTVNVYNYTCTAYQYCVSNTVGNNSTVNIYSGTMSSHSGQFDFANYSGTIGVTSSVVYTPSKTLGVISFISATQYPNLTIGTPNGSGSMSVGSYSFTIYPIYYGIIPSSISGTDNHSSTIYDNGSGSIYTNYGARPKIATINYTTGVVTSVTGGSDYITTINYNYYGQAGSFLDYGTFSSDNGAISSNGTGALTVGTLISGSLNSDGGSVSSNGYGIFTVAQLLVNTIEDTTNSTIEAVNTGGGQALDGGYFSFTGATNQFQAYDDSKGGVVLYSYDPNTFGYGEISTGDGTVLTDGNGNMAYAGNFYSPVAWAGGSKDGAGAYFDSYLNFFLASAFGYGNAWSIYGGGVIWGQNVHVSYSIWNSYLNEYGNSFGSVGYNDQYGPGLYIVDSGTGYICSLNNVVDGGLDGSVLFRGNETLWDALTLGQYDYAATSVAVTGTLSPNAAGTYTYAGIYYGTPYYQNGIYYMWHEGATWDTGGNAWFIGAASPGLAMPAAYWTLSSSSVTPPSSASWSKQGTATGTLTTVYSVSSSAIVLQALSLSDSNLLELYESGNATLSGTLTTSGLTTSGTVIMTGLPTSGGSTYACFNSLHQLVSQSGAC